MTAATRPASGASSASPASSGSPASSAPSATRRRPTETAPGPAPLDKRYTTPDRHRRLPVNQTGSLLRAHGPHRDDPPSTHHRGQRTLLRLLVGRRPSTHRPAVV